MSRNLPPENPYQAPISPANSFPSNKPSGPMGLKEILTSFEGRIPRSTYWLWSIALGFTAMFVMMGVLLAGDTLLGEDNPLTLILAIVFYFPFLYCMFAIQTKRWHDRDKSGWWALIGFVPYIGGIWMLIDCGLLAGTPGRNRYGNNPLR